MSRSRLIPLAAVLAVAGLASVASADPINFTSGSGYVEANINGTPSSATNTALVANPANPLAVNSATGGFTAGASFNNTSNSTSIAITGQTSASRGVTGAAGTGSAFGLSAPNNPAQGGTTSTAPLGYGYFTNFSIGQAGTYNFNLGWSTPANSYSSTTAGPTNYAYSDFTGYLWDVNHNTVYALGGSKSTDGQFNFPPQLPDLSGTPAAGASQVLAALGSNLLNLGTGQYQLYLQSQSYVQGTSGTQQVTTNINAGLTFVSAAVPEPASLTVFGALTAGGLTTLLRRRKA